MKIRISQPSVNVSRTILNQEGYAKDFEMFYEAGKALSEWPKTKLLAQNSSFEQVEALSKEMLEFEVSDAALKVLKVAIKHYIDQKKTATEHHYELLLALGIDPKNSLS